MTTIKHRLEENILAKGKGKEVQNKWRNVKDKFMKELALQKKVESGRAAKKKRKYCYFNSLLFLIHSTNQQPTIGDVQHNPQDTAQISESESEVAQQLHMKKKTPQDF